MALLTSVISMAGSSEYAASSNCSLLFVGACRVDEGLTKEVVLRNLQQELEQCECICLEGFDAESLNKMMSEVLCLPCRKTLSLSKTIHEKTLGVPLFVVEVREALVSSFIVFPYIHYSV
jgi:predicted ATPase